MLTVLIVKAPSNSFPAAFYIKTKSFSLSALSLNKVTFIPSYKSAKSFLSFFLSSAAFFPIIFSVNCFICLTLSNIIRASFFFINLAERFFPIIKKEISKK
jgi:hypothetical protein